MADEFNSQTSAHPAWHDPFAEPQIYPGCWDLTGVLASERALTEYQAAEEPVGFPVVLPVPNRHPALV